MTTATEQTVETVDFFNLTAQRIYHKPDGWKWFSLDAHNKPDDYIEVVGCVPVGVITRGPRKGEPKWGPGEKVWMRRSEIELVKRQWEAGTGKCSNCCGRGQVVWSVSVTDGKKYRECSRCDGTGAATMKGV